MRRPLRAGISAVLGLALVMVASVPSMADQYSDQRAQVEAKEKAVKQALADLASELEDTSAALVQAYADLKGIQAQIPVAQAQLKDAQNKLAELQRQAALIAQRLQAATDQEKQIGDQIAADTTKAADLHAAIGQMARDAYRGDLATSTMSAILDASSTADFVQESELAQVALRTQTQALRDVEQIVAVNRNREARLTAVRQKITELKAEADQNVLDAKAAKERAAARTIELADLETQAKAKTQQIEAQKADQLAKQNDLKAQQDKLAADLKAIIAKQEAARRAAGKRPIGSTANQPFINPTSVNPIYKTSNYGMRFHPILHIWRLHAGVDLRTWCNTPIYAAADGTVVWTKYRYGFGNQVMVNSGYWKGKSLMESYNHLTSFAVSPGQHVKQGQLIAHSGSTGTSDACHLHFEVYLNGNTVDPWPMIAK
ncbi:peptidoglycan DD-metalloendopeptidase family protein [Isoptericola sp. b441]|uniref:Peptidoglycan DD-metalloendopeptidase family protein n=1 Tax=Actinotalea lenta TaxID=3064654 RepID=A0ABT9D9Y9_9CELL|nr:MULTISPECIES: M23 family metallopeptidase [unclassified Isoptericola]MDO8107079.1 peptidoglycan DD-metalloendopeptidase family protein [Isoptericola sp. b441]MDO8121207.1 peptidoglycan DD-metalloendopeptidase family protein [Isoptericola sp. b490]